MVVDWHDRLDKLRAKVRATFADRCPGGNDMGDMDAWLLAHGKETVGPLVLEAMQDKLETLQLAIMRHEDDCKKKGGNYVSTPLNIPLGLGVRMLRALGEG
eukprot:2597809-Pyramimonas_sp.AAC.1